MPDLVPIDHNPFADELTLPEPSPPPVEQPKTGDGVEAKPQPATLTPVDHEPEFSVSATDLPTAQPAGPWDWRNDFKDELNNPAVRDRLAAYTNAEVGNQGPRAQQAFMETIFNRAKSRGQSLAQTLSGPYFPLITHWRARQPLSDAQRGYYGDMLEGVLGGSNTANYATGNASGRVGFAGGPRTSAYNGERFGIEGPDAKWAREQGYAGPLPPVIDVAKAPQPPGFAGADQYAANVPQGAPTFGGQPQLPQQPAAMGGLGTALFNMYAPQKLPSMAEFLPPGARQYFGGGDSSLAQQFAPTMSDATPDPVRPGAQYAMDYSETQKRFNPTVFEGPGRLPGGGVRTTPAPREIARQAEGAGNYAEAARITTGEVRRAFPTAEESGTGYKLPLTDTAGESIGHFEFNVTPNAVVSRYPFIESGSQGKGEGLRAYQKLVDWALSTGREFRSDRSISPQAAKIYDALERRGYNVMRDPTADVSLKGAMSGGQADSAIRIDAGPRGSMR